jgi:hypothetical protein
MTADRDVARNEVVDAWHNAQAEGRGVRRRVADMPGAEREGTVDDEAACSAKRLGRRFD